VSRLDRTRAILLIIDVQEKLMPVIHDGGDVARNIERLVRGCHALGVPTIVTEQYVKGLGPTIGSVRDVLEELQQYRPVEKMCFSASGCTEFVGRLRSLGERRQILVAGIETHVCVYQTVSDLLHDGYEVTLLADALSSRTTRNRDIALTRMTSDGALLSSTEMALFELTVNSGTDEFKTISKLVR
jgi:nicotinamidase-related amidase